MAPGIGEEDDRPLGDMPEAHDEISPRDLPKATPADAPPSASPRTATGRHMATRKEVATSGLEFAAGAEQPETVTKEEAREGARIRR